MIRHNNGDIKYKRREMLLSVTLENWMSFAEPVTFSMMSSRERQHNERLHHLEKHRKKVLPIAAIYGGNASGKTNFFKAINFAQNFIVKGTRPDNKINIQPFLLSNEVKPVRFEFMISIENDIYEYSFKIDKNQVIEEKLIKVLVSSEKVEYKRKYNKIEFSRKYKDKDFYRFASKVTRKNQLFLTNSIDLDMPDFRELYNWFKNTLRLLDPKSSFVIPENLFEENSEELAKICETLKALDTGIESIKSVDDKVENLGLPKGMIEEIQEKLSDGESAYLHNSETKDRIYISNKDGNLKIKKLATFHRNIDGELVPFGMNFESDGSLRVMDLIPAILGLIFSGADPAVLLVDEFDRSLHTLLTKALLDAYLGSCDGIKKKAQFIFTTHDVLLMDQSLLRRDEMWLVERNSKGVSDLFSLSEFNDIRFDKDIRKSYLLGRMGGVPKLSCNIK